MNLNDFLKKIFTLIFVGIIIFGCFKLIKAASGDYWSIGYDRTNSNEILRLNSSGYLIPGKDNTYDLGTSALSWKSLYLDGTATIATLSNTDLTSGKVVMTTASFPAAYVNVGGAAKTIIPSSTFLVLSSFTSVTMTATPTVSTGSIASGTILILASTGAVITVGDNDTTTNSDLELMDTTRVIGPGRSLILQYEDVTDKWFEIGYTNTYAGTLSALTVNTGQGAYELYAMNQNVRITDSPTFSSATLSTSGLAVTAGGISVAAGNITLAGPGTISITNSGIYSSTGVFHTGGIHVSTGTALNSFSCQFAGAVSGLPTSGYTECDMVYLISDHKLYIATETVAGTYSWLAAY